MLVSSFRDPRPQHRPPPLWYVSNGETTVGPVNTGLLQRGVWFNRIPEDCFVRELTWRSWRPLEDIREVRAVIRAREQGALWIAPPRVPGLDDITLSLSRALDAPEVLTLALNECCTHTQAAYGVVHRAWRAWDAPLISCVRGIGMTARLGRAIDSSDPSIALARVGGVVVSHPDSGPVERSIAERFGSPGDLEGVAMVPITSGRYLLGVVELGRIGHPFRSNDVGVLEHVARAAATSIELFARG